MAFKSKINPFTGKLQLIPTATAVTFKDAVADEASLPAMGNTIGDARVTTDNGHVFVWDGSAWSDAGTFVDVTWDGITGKPSSSPSEIDDAVEDSHVQNTDTILDEGGDNEVTAEEVREHIDSTSNPHSVTKAQVGLGSVPNLDTTDAVTNQHTHANKTLLDSYTQTNANIADAVTKKHTSGTETQGGDISGTVASATVDKVKGKTVVTPTASEDGKVAYYNHGTGQIDWKTDATGGGGGAGAVDSVNGQDGDVVLTADDIDTDEAGVTIQEALDAKQDSLVFTPEDVANKDIDGTLTDNSDTKYPSQKAVKTYVDNLLTASNAVVYKGAIDCSSNPNYPAANAGDLYRVSVAGKIGGASGPNVQAGDTLLCFVDSTSSGDHATVGTSWNIIQVNLDGAVIGPSSAVGSNIVEFDATTGKLIKDGGLSHADISDAISKKHTQGTDQGLDTGGANAVTAAQAKAGYTHSQTAHAPSDAVSLATVKADSDISDAISEKHTHANQATLDGIQESFTTLLKNKLGAIEASADVTDAGNIASSIVGVDAKDTPVDADTFGLIDSADGNSLKELSWANSKATLKSYFDTLYQAIGTYLSNIVEDTTPELGGELDCGSHSIGFTEQAITSSSNEATIDWKASNKAKLTLSENVTTFNFTAPSNPCNLVLRVIQDATPRTISWPASVKWAAGTAPTLTTTAGRIDLITFYFDGTYFYGSYIQNFNIS